MKFWSDKHLALLLFLAAAPAAAQDKPAAVDTRVTVGGYLQADARQADQGDLKQAPSHEVNLRRARVSVSGRASRTVTYIVGLQGDGGNANTASLLDASIDVAISPTLKVRAGQFKYDFDLEGRESAHSITMIDRSFATNAIAGGLNGASTPSSTSGSFRDRGVTLIGDLPTPVKWSWSAGVFQGSGRAADNNSDWALVAGVRAEPLAGVRVNLGYLNSNTADEGARSASYRAWTAGGSWERRRLFVRGEYYDGEDLNGFYLTGVFSVVPSLDVSARVQSLDDHRFAGGGATASSIDLGAKWYFVRRDARSGTFVGLNYMSRDADAGFTRGLTLLNDGRGVALTDGRAAGAVIAARLQVRF